MKELEKLQKQPNYDPRASSKVKDSKKTSSKNIDQQFKQAKKSIPRFGGQEKDKTILLVSEDLNKSITGSGEDEGSSNRDIEVNILRQQVQQLKVDLTKAHRKITQLEREVNNEDELNKILNSSFAGSDHNTLSFYGVPTREAKSPNIPRNLTHMKRPNKKFELSDQANKLQESLKYYKYKARTLQKNFDNLSLKHKKVNKKLKDLYKLNDKLINALKAQKSFEKLSGDKKTVTCKN